MLSLIALNCITMTVFMDPVLTRMLEGEHGVTDKQWAESRWLLPILSPPDGDDCKLTDIMPCSPAQWIDFSFLLVRRSAASAARAAWADPGPAHKQPGAFGSACARGRHICACSSAAPCALARSSPPLLPRSSSPSSWW